MFWWSNKLYFQQPWLLTEFSWNILDSAPDRLSRSLAFYSMATQLSYESCAAIGLPTLTSVPSDLLNDALRSPIGQWVVSLGCHVLITVSDRGDNKCQWATHSLIKWLTSTAFILRLVVLIPLNFLYDKVQSVFLIVGKFESDTTSQCSVTIELKYAILWTQPLFSPACTSTTYGNAV